MNEGPCDVSDGTWTCPNVGIGGSHSQDKGSYQVWVTVIDPSDVRQLENALVKNGSVISGDEPPHAGQGGGIYSENVTR